MDPTCDDEFPADDGAFAGMTRRSVLSMVVLGIVASACNQPHSTATNAATTAPGAGAGGPGGSGAATVPRPTFVGGRNAYLTTGILEANDEEYGGSWTGQWSYDDASAAGVVTADIDIDYRGRKATATCTIDGALMAEAIVPFDIAFDVDSFVYDGDTKHFTVNYQSPLGPVTVTDAGGGGRFKLTMSTVTGHPDVTGLSVTGALNHPSLVPMTFQVTKTDGSMRAGTASFTRA